VALRRLLTERPASYQGRFYRFAGVSIEPGPFREAGPPLLVGGRSEAALRRAGALADGWLPYLVSPGRYAAGVTAVREHARAAGRDEGALEHVLVTFAHVDEDGERAREAAQLHLSQRYGMAFERHHVERLCIVGSSEECAGRIREYGNAGVTHLCLNPAVEEAAFLDQVARLYDVAASARSAVA
jgi:alkanesulfonate monooxygenase SsuD/methylene tetrahydromethanopterin reductase-like flavin-dependent oxidoreductase (luciferase family)